MSQSISIFFPARNEEKNIKECITKANEYIKTKGIDYEIIVINDGSTDKTAEIVKEVARNNPRIILVNNEGPNGYGNALRKGFAACTKSLVFFSDSDLQFDIEDLDPFLNVIDKYDYVVGYRKKRSDPYFRSVNAKLYSILVRIVLGVKMKDLDCAFKLFHASVLNSITLHSEGALITAEIIYKLNHKNYKYLELPVSHFPRKEGAPSGANLRVIFKMFIELFKLKFKISY